MKWQPIETAPKDERLLFLRGTQKDELYIASWSDEHQNWCLKGWGPLTHSNIKYWLPIPEIEDEG